MDLQKSKEFADRIVPMLQEIEETDAVAAKMIDVFASGLKLGGQLERERKISDDAQRTEGGSV